MERSRRGWLCGCKRRSIGQVAVSGIVILSAAKAACGFLVPPVPQRPSHTHTPPHTPNAHTCIAGTGVRWTQGPTRFIHERLRALWMVRRDAGSELTSQDFVDAVAIYRSTYGSGEVAEDFVVPLEAAVWPERFQGIKLGKLFRRLVLDGELRDESMTQVRRLEKEAGVHVRLSDWEKCVLSLQTFKDVKGNLKVPARFIVPSEPPWPQEIWGYRLGSRVTAIRTTGKFVMDNPAKKEDRIVQLDDLGFDFKPRQGREKQDDLSGWADKLVEGLQAYAELVDPDVNNILAGFVVPEAAEWPKALWGQALGQKVAYVKSKPNLLSDHPDTRDALLNLGFVISSREAQNEERFQLILRALRTFKSVNGHVNVPQSFVVPEGDPWPQETWGMRLGIRVNAIRSQQTFIKNNTDRRKMLEDLGFDITPSKPAARRKDLDKYEYTDDYDIDAPSYGVTPPNGGAPSNGPKEDRYDPEQQDPEAQAAAVAEARRRMAEAGPGGLSKEEILELQEKAGLEWYFINRQPGQSWYEKVDNLGLSNYPFVPLLSPDQYAKIKQKGDSLLRGNRINPYFRLMAPPLKQHASEVEIYPTGSLLDNLAQDAAKQLDPDGDVIEFVGRLRDDTRVSRIDYRPKLVPDSDIDKSLPVPLDEGEYWEGVRMISDGNMDEFGEEGSFEDIIHAFEVFKDRYGHVNVPPGFEFRTPEETPDEDDWFSTWTGRAEQEDDWDSEAEPEHLKNLQSFSTLYDPAAEEAKRKAKLLKEKADAKEDILAGLFGDEEEEDAFGSDPPMYVDDGGRGLERRKADRSADFWELEKEMEEEEKQELDPMDDNDVVWPEEVDMLPLADISFMLRSGVIAAKDVPERRAALDALGFDWGPEEAYVDLRWDVFLGTYYHWRMIKGVPLVPWDFVVPEEAPWPFFCRGVELGRLCNLIRRNQDIFFKYYPERCTTLEYFGWKWWWPTLEEGEEPDAPAPYNRYNNFEGMDELINLGFVNPDETDMVTQPDFDAIAAEVPESIPWRQQDHETGLESVDFNGRASIFKIMPGGNRNERAQQAYEYAAQAAAAPPAPRGRGRPRKTAEP